MSKISYENILLKKELRQPPTRTVVQLPTIDTSTVRKERITRYHKYARVGTYHIQTPE
jgi:hypothetical protein